MSGHKSCEYSEEQEMLSKSSSEQLINTSEASMVFDVYNLLFGILCLGAALLTLGISYIIRWYRSRSNSKPKFRHAVIACATFLIVIHTLLFCPTLYFAPKIIDFVNEHFDKLQELCSPWPLYSVIVSSGLVVGLEGLVCIGMVTVLCGLVCVMFYVPIMYCTM